MFEHATCSELSNHQHTPTGSERRTDSEAVPHPAEPSLASPPFLARSSTPVPHPIPPTHIHMSSPVTQEPENAQPVGLDLSKNNKVSTNDTKTEQVPAESYPIHESETNINQVSNIIGSTEIKKEIDVDESYSTYTVETLDHNDNKHVVSNHDADIIA